jgi:hypothetical protein
MLFKKVRRLELQMSKILIQKHFFLFYLSFQIRKQSHHKLSGGSSSLHHPGFSTPTHSSPDWKVKYDQRHPRYNPCSYPNIQIFGYSGLRCTAHNWINLKNQSVRRQDLRVLGLPPTVTYSKYTPWQANLGHRPVFVAQPRTPPITHS